ncbi:response regulator transcription factor [Hydrogenophaga sp. PAMC20947]|uniref:LuxR C-terminal-related transcriptional regulator n=1 Tax=Hydrogenophaga sp. PAMC20947 TaxID=2565558 RepID=UPI00109DC2C5|nr:response regulator transcription factor [Hydrogenophaga sp. PAMC20947]QCB45718.1 response regulator transcription factor [Hydrogenophaga sp. PAMC20947]
MPDLEKLRDIAVATEASRLYLIEDDTSVLQFVQQSLLLRPEWRLQGVSGTRAHARQHALNAPVDVYLVDLGLPDGRGETLLRWLSEERPDSELLVFTVFGDETRLLAALQAGATGYVLKGCSHLELVLAIEQIQSGGAPISPLLARMLLGQFRPPSVGEGETRVALSRGEVLLSERETEVLQLLAKGYVNKEIALKLGISPATVGSHIKNLYRKLAVHSRVQVVRAAQERGLL